MTHTILPRPRTNPPLVLKQIDRSLIDTTIGDHMRANRHKQYRQLGMILVIVPALVFIAHLLLSK